MERASIEIAVLRAVAEGLESRQDQVAVEEPLEIRLAFGPAGKRDERSISITMRTPGHDAELAAGFLFGEGIVSGNRDIEAIRHCGAETGAAGSFNVVRVELRPKLAVDLTRLESSGLSSMCRIS